MTDTKKQPRYLHIGRSFTVPDAVASKRGNKFARRMLRAQAKKRSSSIEQAITAAHVEVAEAQDVSENAHAARRLLEEERAARSESNTQANPPQGSPAVGEG